MDTSQLATPDEPDIDLADDEFIENINPDDENLAFTYDVSYYGVDFPVDGLIKRLDNEDIYIPELQRDFVWKDAQVSKFIESLLLGLPIPEIFLAKDTIDQYLIVDGLQRLTSLRKFCNESHVLSGVREDFKGKTYQTLASNFRRKLDNYPIHAVIVSPIEPDDSLSAIYQIFERLNTGGTQLDPQEIRNCIYRGPFNKLLIELNKNEQWRTILDFRKQKNKSWRYKDIELILRFFALYYDLENYKKPMGDFLNHFMSTNRNLTLRTAETFKTVFENTINVIYTTFGTNAFRSLATEHSSAKRNNAICDSLLYATAKIMDLGSFDRNKYADLCQKLIGNPDYINLVSRSTTNDKTVKDRCILAYQTLKAASSI